MNRARQRGFTLLELVVAIGISAILAGFMSMLIGGPIEAFFADSRRARLADTADTVWQNIERDVSTALPNNVRAAAAGNLRALEMLTVANVGRYGTDLDIGIPDNAFTAPGNFSTPPAGPPLVYGGPPYLAIVGVGTPANSAYGFGNVMTGNGVTTSISAAGAVNLSAPMTFLQGSQRRRAYIVSGAVSYVCDTANGTVTRYSGYNINAAQPVAPGAFVGGTNVLIANNVTACTFTTPPGAGGVDNGGTVLIRYTVTTPAGEALTLSHDARIENPA